MGSSRSWIFGMLFFVLCGVGSVRAQSAEVEQLLLNVEKLSQLKNILADMKKGYQVVSQGYNAVKNIAQGNFSLHDVFLNGLWLVSPEVRKYQHVADILSDQALILSEYKSAFKRFAGSGSFSASELDYIGKVYSGLFSQSLDNLDQLLMVITSGTLRISDEERLSSIDRIHADTKDKLIFLRHFNREASVMQLNRKGEQAELESLSGYFKP